MRYSRIRRAKTIQIIFGYRNEIIKIFFIICILWYGCRYLQAFGRHFSSQELYRRSYKAEDKAERAVAVSLDIANAFGIHPYTVLEEALRFYGVAFCLCCLVGHYVSDRLVPYEAIDGHRNARNTACGLPRGTFSGPTFGTWGPTGYCGRRCSLVPSSLTRVIRRWSSGVITTEKGGRATGLCCGRYDNPPHPTAGVQSGTGQDRGYVAFGGRGRFVDTQLEFTSP